MAEAIRTGVPVKVVIAGGFGVGKTTLVGAVSDIEPIRTETCISTAGAGVDDLSAAPDKQTTTVAMDFGRVDLDTDITLYLFGTPGQRRFWFMWSELCRGALGAIVLVNPRRLADCFGIVDFFETNRLPYVVVVNRFDGAKAHTPDELREALAVGGHVPVLFCDARRRSDVREVLVCLVEHLIWLRTPQPVNI